jgi:hypothetical protein
MADRKGSPDRPMILTLYAVASLLVGIVIIIMGTLALAGFEFLLPGDVVNISSITTVSVIFLLFAVLFILIGFGMWFLWGWTRALLLIFVSLCVILDPLRLAFLLSSTSGKEWATIDIRDLLVFLISIALSVISLWFLSRPQVISAMEAGEMTRVKKHIRSTKERIELARMQCNAGEMTKAELAKIRADCLEEERSLRAKKRHLEKLRLNRERKLKERAKLREEARKEKMERREEKRAEKEEKKAEREAKKEGEGKGSEDKGDSRKEPSDKEKKDEASKAEE